MPPCALQGARRQVSMAMENIGVRKFGHPGKGSRGARYKDKGRQVEPEALGEIQALLGDKPRRRDLLIEHLHIIQDSAGHLSPRHLTALAHEMKLSLAEVYEVATPISMCWPMARPRRRR